MRGYEKNFGENMIIRMYDIIRMPSELVPGGARWLAQAHYNRGSDIY